MPGFHCFGSFPEPQQQWRYFPPFSLHFVGKLRASVIALLTSAAKFRDQKMDIETLVTPQLLSSSSKSESLWLKLFGDLQQHS